ncbi:MAG: Gfo/Idh/MocA family protein [Vicinamibacterales bacterium]
MTSSRLRAAIIGTGRVASLLERDPLRSKPHTHAAWYRACYDTDLVAGCDIDTERLAAFGIDWGLPAESLYTDYRNMLARERPDLVSICGYAPDRLAMVRAAVACGARGLWVEKAIACSIDEADDMLALVREKGVAVVVDQPRRGDSRYRAVGRAIADGTFGALQSIHCAMSGHLMHTGIHAWDVLHFWIGPWREARAWLSASSAEAAAQARVGDPLRVREGRHGPLPGDDADALDGGGHAHILFENGTHVFVSGSVKRYFVFQFDLWFDAGRVRIGNDVDEVQIPEPSPRYSGFVELGSGDPLDPVPPARPLVEDLVHAVRTGDEPWMSLPAAREAFVLGAALFQSDLECHRAVTPDQVRRDLYIASV